MQTKQILSLTLYIILISLLLFGCKDSDASKPSASFPFPSEPPDITIPVKFELDGQLATIQAQKISINSSIENQRFL